VRKDASEGVIEVAAMPWIQHSTRLVVTDPRYWEGARTVLAVGVTYRHEQRKARTVIEWRALQGTN
jgi:hypothetical protein